MTATMNSNQTSADVAKPADPIDALLPRPYRWWIRLAIASTIITAVAVIGYMWHFGVIRPSPDCCGSGSSGAQIGLANVPDAVTVNVYFFNSSNHKISIDGATAALPGATVIDIAPFTGNASFESPPENLGTWPVAVGDHGQMWMAVTFIPDTCPATGNGGDWGTVTLDLSVGGDPWYPTLGRSFEIPEAIAPAGENQLGVLPPARLDGAFSGNEHPLEAACILLGR